LKPEILKIRLSDLESFSQSEVFKSWETVPVSNLRIQSYLHNPDANPDDIVLFVALTENKLVAFRTLFAGSVRTVNGNERFGWCSGNWVHPDFRRKGFSELLLNEAFADWNGKLMFTNYAPNSEKLYLKTGKFKPIYQFQGFRGYLFVKTSKLAALAKKNVVNKIFFGGIDFGISILASVRTWFFKPGISPDISFSELEFPDEECYTWLEERKNHSVFQRGVEEFQWIFNFPWITAQKNSDREKYPFSSFSESFRYHAIKVFDKKSFTGFFIFSVRDGHLKTLCFFAKAGFEESIAGFLKQFCVNHKIEVITVYNYEISRYLFARKFPFLRAKNYGQKIYSSFNFDIAQHQQFQDGDGDVIFT
jgi:GNAT superfamily N-acetyltransferase